MTQPTTSLSGADSDRDDAEASEPTVHDFNTAGRLAVSWLHDSGDKRILLLTGPLDGLGGPEADGSTLMAATLADLAPELPERARIHAQASARGLNASVLTWVLAAQLDLCAATPTELALHLSADPRPATVLIAELDASGPGHLGWATRGILDEVLRPLLTVPGLRLIVQTAHTGLFGTAADILPIAPHPVAGPAPRPRPAVLGTTPVQDALMSGRLVALCADPAIAAEATPTTLAVAATTVLRHLPAAAQIQISTFGQGLITTEPPFGYVLHHAAAVATGDAALAAALEPHIADLPIRAAWARWRPAPGPGAVSGEWPGAVATLAPHGEGTNEFLLTDQTGRTHVLDVTDGTELGRVPGPRKTFEDLAPSPVARTLSQGAWHVSTSASGTLVLRRDGVEADQLNLKLGWTPTATLIYENGTLLVGGRHGLLCFRPMEPGA